MSEFQLSPNATMFYRDDDFTDPWRTPETIVLLHGNCENGMVWNSWVPRLGRRFRVIRPDMRGFGQSTPMPEEYQWTLDGIVEDYARLLDSLGIKRCHIVGAKIAAAVAIRFAVTHPERALTVTITGNRVISGRQASRKGEAALAEQIRQHGVVSHARETMSGRLGNAASPEMYQWWIETMGATATSTQLGFIRSIPNPDLSADLPRIACPLLLLTAEESGTSHVEEARAQMKIIPRGELIVLLGESYHVAATQPEECVDAVLSFIDRSTPVAV